MLLCVLISWLIQSASSGASSCCPAGWSAGSDGNCYKQFSSSWLSFSEAVSFCTKENPAAHIPTPSTPEEMNALDQFKLSQSWVGLVNTANDGWSAYACTNTNKYVIRNWISEDPKIDNTFQCAITPGQITYRPRSCTDDSQVVCRIVCDSNDPSVIVSDLCAYSAKSSMLDVCCPFGWTKHTDGHCYQTRNEGRTYQQAWDWCTARDPQAHIPSPTSQAEFDNIIAIRNQLVGQIIVWIPIRIVQSTWQNENCSAADLNSVFNGWQSGAAPSSMDPDECVILDGYNHDVYIKISCSDGKPPFCRKMCNEKNEFVPTCEDPSASVLEVSTTTLTMTETSTANKLTTTLHATESSTKQLTTTTQLEIKSTTIQLTTTLIVTESSTKQLTTTTQSEIKSTTKQLLTTTLIVTESSTKQLTTTTLPEIESTTKQLLTTTLLVTESSTKQLTTITLFGTKSSTKQLVTTTLSLTESMTKQLTTPSLPVTEISTKHATTTIPVTESSTKVTTTALPETEFSTKRLTTTTQSVAKSSAKQLTTNTQLVTKTSTNQLASTQLVTESSTKHTTTAPLSVTESSPIQMTSATGHVAEKSTKQQVTNSLVPIVHSSKWLLSTTTSSTFVADTASESTTSASTTLRTTSTTLTTSTSQTTTILTSILSISPAIETSSVLTMPPDYPSNLKTTTIVLSILTNRDGSISYENLQPKQKAEVQRIQSSIEILEIPVTTLMPEVTTKLGPKFVKPPLPLTKTEVIVVETVQSLGCIWLLGILGVTIVGTILLKNFTKLITIQLSQDVTLFVAHVLILLFRDKTEEVDLCVSVAVLLQFFFSCTFGFVMIEAIYSHCIMSRILPWNKFPSLTKTISVGLAIPFVFSLLCGVVIQRGYHSAFSCWIDYDHNLSMMLIGTTMVISFAALLLTETANDFSGALPNDNRELLNSAMISRTGIFFILPCNFLSWLFGSLAIYNQQSSLFGVVFIMNILLGVCVWMFHTLSNPKLRAMVSVCATFLKSKLCKQTSTT